MEVGEGILFPVSVVDGLVHELGGTRLRLECKFLQLFRGGCPTGTATSTSSGALERYDRIVHVSPPFFEQERSEALLGSCYRAALALAFGEGDRVACPLIGAGARGFGLDAAVGVAAREILRWRNDEDGGGERNRTVAFGIPILSTANDVMRAIEMELVKEKN